MVAPAEALLDVILDSIPGMVAYWDADLWCRYVKRAAGSRSEPQDELAGKHLHELPPAARPFFDGPMIEAALRGEPQEIEREIPDPTGGAPRYARLRYVPHEASGAVRGVIAVVADITDRHRTVLALRRREHELREAQRVARCGSWEWDPATNTTLWSDELFRICDRDPALGPPGFEQLADYASPEQFAALGVMVQRALVTGEPYEIDSSFRRSDGSTAWVYARAEGIRGEDGKIVGLRGTSVDVTARKEAELTLARREAELLEAQRIAGMGSWDWVAETGQITWSPGLRELLGVPHDAAPSRYPEGFAQFYDPENLARLRAAVAKALRDGTPYSLDLELRPLSTGVRWVQARGEATRDARGKITGLHGTLLDITAQHETLRALRESEARHELIASAMQDVIWLWDSARGRFEYVSPSVQRLLGCSAGEALLLGLGDLGGTQVGQAGATQQKVLRRRGGGEVPVEVIVTPVLGADGQVKHLQGVTRDITHRKRLESEVLQLQRLESVGRLAGGVAHDFNNQLTVIIGQLHQALELAADRGTSLRESLEDALAAASSSAELTGQLLAFARKQVIAPRVLDLNEVITGALTMLRRLVGEAIDLVWDPSAAAWPVRLDPGQVQQILTNLVVNARDAIRSTGRITVTTANTTLDETFCAEHPGAAPGEYLEVTVSDTGTGISPEVRARIFEPFFTTKGPGKGTGLGLSIVYGIVQQNGGAITVDSEPGAGARFRIFFPRHRQHGAEEPVRREEVQRGAETVLLVEDERAVLKLTRNILIRLGYRVLDAAEPARALALAREHAGEIDLLVSDVVMPHMSGRDLAREIHRMNPRLPCLFISGFSADVLDEDGGAEGAMLLPKPFTRASLAAAVRQALDRAPRSGLE